MGKEEDKSINLKAFDELVKYTEDTLPKMMEGAIDSAKGLKDMHLPSSNPIDSVSNAYNKWRLNGAIKDLEKVGPEGVAKAVEELKTVQSGLHLSDVDKNGTVTKEEIEQGQKEVRKYRELTGNKNDDPSHTMAELSEKGIDSFDKLKAENKGLENKAELEKRFDKMDGLVRSKSEQAEFDKFVDRDGDGKNSNKEIADALKTMDDKGLDTLNKLKEYNAQHANSASTAQGAGQAQDRSAEIGNGR